MAKRKVLIAVHQLNIGGVQKSLIPALNAIDYTQNDVTLYVRKNRCDLLPLVNKNVSEVIVNKDKTKYYRKPYAVYLHIMLKLYGLLKKDKSAVQKKLNNYIISQQMKYEKEHYFSDNKEYDVAVSYIQSHTAKFVCDNVNAKKKVMFFRGSTDENHEMHMEIMKSFDSIYCVSCGSKEALARLYPIYEYKMRVIDTFVDYESVIKKSTEYDVKKGKITLASCGRITVVKGFDLAVEAAKILKDKNIDFLWYFVGDGSCRSQIDDLINQYGLEDKIVITGLKENPYPYLESCDIYIQPSLEESFGRTIKEAMILGKPVVSTKTVGGCEQITDKKNGVLTEITSKSIADGINTLLEDKELFMRIVDNLKSVDYSMEIDNYKQKWKKLLEE